MNAVWVLTLFNERLEPVWAVDLDGPAELGRQRPNEPVYTRRPSRPLQRVVIAANELTTVPRHFVVVEPLSAGIFRLKNPHEHNVVHLSDGRQIRPGHSLDIDSTVTILAASFQIGLQRFESLTDATLPPGQGQFDTVSFAADRRGGEPTSTVPIPEVLRWLKSTLDVFQSAATSDQFFDKAARALVELVHLDTGFVLQWDGSAWNMAAMFPPQSGELGYRASERILDRVRLDKRTFWEVPGVGLSDHSMACVNAVVAAPILDCAGQVIGAIYGDRRSLTMPITQLQASFVELLASGVASGLARLDQERVRAQFAQFFTRELAESLTRHPDWLKGRSADVSLLFCDIRGFSRISEHLGAARTVEWCKAVLDHLSRCVLAEAGVLVDYTGDGLMALWGAPGEQPDHARRACRCAIAMMEGLPALNAEWQSELGRPMEIGIGIHSGNAVVGNVGSTVKFKYGARGPVVNLASRVEGATKHLKCQTLITGGTVKDLGDEFRTRRLCRVKVKGIEEAVDLYELAADRPDWPDAREQYERALAEFERKDFGHAAWRLADLRKRQDHDGPALVLLARVVNWIVESEREFDPVWVLPTK